MQKIACSIMALLLFVAAVAQAEDKGFKASPNSKPTETQNGNAWKASPQRHNGLYIHIQKNKGHTQAEWSLDYSGSYHSHQTDINNAYHQGYRDALRYHTHVPESKSYVCTLRTSSRMYDGFDALREKAEAHALRACLWDLRASLCKAAPIDCETIWE